MPLQKFNNNGLPLVWDYGDGSFSPVIANNSPIQRTALTLHRANITTYTDIMAAMSAPVTADVATGGALLANTLYKTAVAGSNRYGVGRGSATTDTTTANDASNTHVLRVTVPAQTGADRFDLFASTDTNPKWVARITEAQRAAGVTITAVGTIDPTSPGAGKVDIRVVGTGVASTASPFSTPGTTDVSMLTKIPCSGYSNIVVQCQFVPTGFNTSGTAAVTQGFSVFLYDDIDMITQQFTSASIGGSVVIGSSALPHFNRTAVGLNGATYAAIGIGTLTLNSGQTGYVDMYYCFQY